MAVVRRGDVKYLALESVVVLFGVLAALLVDRVRDNASRHEAAQVAVERVYAEVSQNMSEVRDASSDITERLAELRRLAESAPKDESLADELDRFRGYRTPDLNQAAWERLSGSDLADAVDPDLLAEAFHLYESGQQFDQLEGEIMRLVYSELFYLPERRATAIAISERIMEQELSWAKQLIPQYERFLATAPD